ncbi:MAG: hypothetical protein IJS96_00820 [Schwartzia sp.]|nr:hypothetical protein [Schwartzia sp. (in: firmicutes)]
MKFFVRRILVFFAFAVLCAAVFPQMADAKPHIRHRFTHVYLNEPGALTITSYFENTGDRGAYIEWTEFDLLIMDSDRNRLWEGTDLRHYPDELWVGAGDVREYTITLHDDGIPEYHGRYTWKKQNARVHWKLAQG